LDDLTKRVQVVEKQSAILTPLGEIPTYEHQIPTDKNHRGMCRFASSKDKTYKNFIRSVKQIMKGNEVKELKNEFYMVPHTANANFTGRNDIRQQLSDSLVVDRHMRANIQQRFVLYGLGGSGKTQVCLKFAKDHQNK